MEKKKEKAKGWLRGTKMATIGRARQSAESQINNPLPRALYDEADEKEIDKVKGFFVL